MNKNIKKLVLLGSGASIAAGFPNDINLLREVKNYLAITSPIHNDVIDTIILGIRNSPLHTSEIGCETVLANLVNWKNCINNIQNSMVLEIVDPENLQQSTRSLSNINTKIIIDTIQIIKKAYTEIFKTPQKLDHFRPLINKWDENLIITTLNYDLTLEKAASIENKMIDAEIKPNNLHPRLIKLHGSIDWAYETVSKIIKCDTNNTRHIRLLERNGPAVLHVQPKVFPQFEFLDLYSEFRNQLSECTHLIISGYAFKDSHVNYILERWRSDAVDKNIDWKITIIDTNPNLYDEADQKTKNLLVDLSWAGMPEEANRRIKLIIGKFQDHIGETLEPD